MSTATKSPSWLGIDIAEWARRWWSIAPAFLSQPILPGWTFAPEYTINNGNSSAPRTEADIVQRHSYGRQLGRISDALAVLVEERSDLQGHEQFRDFLAMKSEIDAIKAEAFDARVDQIRNDLATLRVTDPSRYRELRAVLLGALEVDHDHSPDPPS